MWTLEGISIIHFTQTEFERPAAMFPPLVWELDKLRSFLAKPIGVHESNPLWVPGGPNSHKKTSNHYLGRAVDVYCRQISLWRFFIDSSRFAFTEIGVYPYWNTPGLHLGIGERTTEPRRYWWRDEEGIYRGLSVYQLEEIFKLSPNGN